MNKNDLIKLAEYLSLEYDDVSDNLLVTCPFAPWTHKSGRDGTPSMSLQVNLTGDSQYNCFGCKEHGPTLDEMLFKLQSKGFDQFKAREALAFIAQAEKNTLSIDTNYEEATTPADVITLHGGPPSSITTYTDDNFFGTFPRAEEYPMALDYLIGTGQLADGTERRSLTLETVRLLGFGFDPRDERVVVPVKWFGGLTIGAIGRLARKPRTRRNGRPEMPYYNYWRFPKSTILFGESLLVQKPVVVCEGPFDAIKVRQAGYNAVATMGAKFSEYQMDKLVEFGERVVVMFDNDEEGQREAQRMARLLRRTGTDVQLVAPVQEKKDPGSMTDAEIQSVLEPSCGDRLAEPLIQWGEI